ncbi:hydroxymethylpyrimidine/phosphomethylpyrimidine kinase [Fulvivirga kasyanovii]|uniref:hydroxymethylpyrimidine kinase n=1 Tax=Fulvivirga kasyanovii TaxID=396812 RepID=A0ABW9RLJ8_9BACT|nr:hydroxymethylpyrimidine/phosphomethylpyrimidine kinase [Fulvivirga kasyanovii]MTI24856.1 hydroxymethylpyrimidine/phosphomethylpyrimidine kinase [Fulvivirga kasyanovii]
MNTIQPVALTIAGYDPCAGAGLLADIKAMEQHGVYGMGTVTANTLQDEDKVYQVNWHKTDVILNQLNILLDRYNIQWVKIGIIEDSKSFSAIKNHLFTHNPEIKIVWDPVLRSSSGFQFFENNQELDGLLENVYLITPNLPEFKTLFKDEETAVKASFQCNIYLKGGHNEGSPGTDFLFCQGNKMTFTANTTSVSPKHGSGCVLSAAITANLALGLDLPQSCISAKTYTEKFLSSHSSLLGWHNKTSVL